MKAFIQKYLDMPNDSREKTIVVAVTLCLFCSILVSAAAVVLRPLQEDNKTLDRKRNILSVAGILDDSKSVNALFDERIESRLVELSTGEYTDALDVATYDQRVAAKDPALSRALDRSADLAGIKRQAKYATVYLVKDGDEIDQYILPVHGYGLWSTLYGFLAFENDGLTISGLSFYEHGETPGLGGEVDNPKWKASWAGKVAYTTDGEPAIRIVKGGMSPNDEIAQHQIDALAGATLTSNGVQNLIEFWLSDQGFGTYIKNLRAR